MQSCELVLTIVSKDAVPAFLTSSCVPQSSDSAPLRQHTYRNFQRAACAQLELQDVAHMISTVSAVDEHVGPVERLSLMHFPAAAQFEVECERSTPSVFCLNKKGFWECVVKVTAKPVPTDGC